MTNAEARRLPRPLRRSCPGDRGRGGLEGALRRSPTRAASSSPPRPTSRAPARCSRTCTSPLLDQERILPGLEELFEALGGDLPSALAIVTGPSRSADIEQTLTVGVHGPGEVHVVLLR